MIFTYLKVSKILEFWFTFLWLVMIWETGSIRRESVISLQYSGLTSSLPSGIDSSSLSQGLRIGFSIALPLRRVMIDLTWSMHWLLELLALKLYFPLGFYYGWEGNLPFSWKLRANVNFARVSFKFDMVWAFWMLIDCCFSMNACIASSRFILRGGPWGDAYP